LGDIAHVRYGLRSYEEQVIPRRARHRHRCHLAAYAEACAIALQDVPQGRAQAAGCADVIEPGTIYVEDRSQVAGYGQSGMRLCVPCALRQWPTALERL